VENAWRIVSQPARLGPRALGFRPRPKLQTIRGSFGLAFALIGRPAHNSQGARTYSREASEWSRDSGSVESSGLQRHGSIPAPLSRAAGARRRGDLSRFVEEAVRAHILELTASQAKAANAGVTEDDLEAIIAEAVDWSRRR